ncbi:MAG: pyridoxamine 5'-phosphate oxidase family protein [Holophaga sp.]|nr:pyridoxamine 5'-phosphate oxidase family protein [Holophaga sp.]
MFHEIRRRDRAITETEAWEILAQSEWGVLSTLGEDGWPYGVPVNHVVLDGRIYLHCAQAGHKLENLAFESRVSYCAVASSEVLPAELSTNFESVVLFGRAIAVNDDTEKRRALEALLTRFAPQHPAEGAEAMRTEFSRTTVVRITPDHISGKARRDRPKH